MSLLGKGYLAFKGATKTAKASGVQQNISNMFVNAAGYRKLGLRADDLIPEENDIVQLAIKRLPPKESYDRTFRLRRGFQLSLSHQLLPPAEQTKPEEDIAYLSPYIAEIEAELQERENLDAVIVERKTKTA